MLTEKLKVFFGIELLHKVSILFLTWGISLSPFSDENFVAPLAPHNNVVSDCSKSLQTFF